MKILNYGYGRNVRPIARYNLITDYVAFKSHSPCARFKRVSQGTANGVDDKANVTTMEKLVGEHSRTISGQNRKVVFNSFASISAPAARRYDHGLNRGAIYNDSQRERRREREKKQIHMYDHFLPFLYTLSSFTSTPISTSSSYPPSTLHPPSFLSNKNEDFIFYRKMYGIVVSNDDFLAYFFFMIFF